MIRSKCLFIVAILWVTTIFTFSITAQSVIRLDNNPQSQDCEVMLSGTVKEKSTQQFLSEVYIRVEETGEIATTNAQGYFEFQGLCKGTYHIRFSHLGCEDYTQFLKIDAQTDPYLAIQLSHYTELLSESVIHHQEFISIQNSTAVDQQHIRENANLTLADMVSEVTGVSVLQNGKNIAKPVIHGLYGNRVGVIVQGVPLQSQQWGLDHGPEVDTFSSDHISVIKGVGVLEYATSATSSLVVMESSKIKKEPHLHGELNTLYDTNGRGVTMNSSFTKYYKFIGLRLVATYKKFVDSTTPNYYLTNTGLEQKNVNLQFQKKLNQWSFDGNLSYFDAQMGILAATYAKSVKALNAAIDNETPGRTNDYFSYTINPPNQKVIHQTFNFKTDYKFSQISKIRGRFAYQRNQRQEFDRRRLSRSEIPEMDLVKYSLYSGLVYAYDPSRFDKITIGSHWNYVKNTNIPGTGIFPLLPDYISNQYGLFSSYKYKNQNLSAEFGAKISKTNLRVATARGQVERFQNTFLNPTLVAGFTYKFTDNFTTSLNIGISSRAPEVNELYSEGLHQGVAAYEYGNPNLSSEYSSKTTLGFHLQLGKSFFIENLVYHNPIQNYIYLKPQPNEPLVTIRGTFNTFTYQQIHALLWGNDFKMVWEPYDQWSIVLKYAYLQGQNLSLNQPLIYMSPNNGSLAVSYYLKDQKYFQKTKFGAKLSHTHRQNRFTPFEDFSDPPPAYTLLSAEVSSELKVLKNPLKLGVAIQNITGVSYRSYLNRLRYFADEQGRNITFRIGYQF